MANRANRQIWAPVLTASAIVLCVTLGGGCDHREFAGGPSEPSEEQAKPLESAPQAVVPVDARFAQTFAEATRQDPPADWQRPPDTTITGKSVGKIYSEVAGSWDSHRLVNSKGQLLDCSAILETTTWSP